jgi:hypothetical protein
MKVNETFFRLSRGNVPIPTGALKEGQEDVSVSVNGVEYIFSVVKTERLNNQDGTYDEVMILKYFSTVD